MCCHQNSAIAELYGCPLCRHMLLFCSDSILAGLCSKGHLQTVAYLVNTVWDLKYEKWVTLPGRKPKQTAMQRALADRAATVRSLRDICRLSLRAVMYKCSGRTEIISRIKQLPVPEKVKAFLMFQDRDYATCVPDLL